MKLTPPDDESSSLRQSRSFPIDTIRGISIFGILMVNLPFLFVDMAYSNQVNPSQFSIGLNIFVDSFFTIKFITIFAIIFGVGLAGQRSKLETDDSLFRAKHKSRMKIMLIFGLIHGLFLFEGDILSVYAITGLFFLRHIHKSNDVLLRRCKRVFITYLIIILIIGLLCIPLSDFDGSDDESFDEFFSGPVAFLILLFFGIIFMGPWLTSLFGIGVYLYKIEFFKPHSYPIQKRYFKRSFLALPVVVICSIAFYTVKNEGVQILFIIPWAISSFFLSLGYIGGITMLCHNQKKNNFILCLSNIGKISLSNYLFQSILCFMVTLTLKENFMVEWNYIQFMPIALLIFSIQLMLSYFLLKKYSTGPFEWLLRRFYSRGRP